MNLEGIDHVALSVTDVERSANWYIEVLGFERRYEDVWKGIPVFIVQGTTAIALFPTESKGSGPSPSPAGLRMLHLAFRATGQGFQIAQQELKRRGISFRFEDHEISHSIYFHDPDGHKLEITTYYVKPA